MSSRSIVEAAARDLAETLPPLRVNRRAVPVAAVPQILVDYAHAVDHWAYIHGYVPGIGAGAAIAAPITDGMSARELRQVRRVAR